MKYEIKIGNRKKIVYEAECNHNYLEKGDILFREVKKAGDICFRGIENIMFCPLCGSKLEGITIKDGK